MEKLYTFILDYRGGTYISQVKGTRLESVFLQWINTYDFSIVEKKDPIIDTDTIKNYLVAIEGLKNIWCTSFLLSDESALVHVVETARA